MSPLFPFVPSPLLQRRPPGGSLSSLGLLRFFVLTWVVGWLISVVCYCFWSGLLPHGNAEWWGYPIVLAWAVLPVSFGGLVRDVVASFAPLAANAIAIACTLAYWPAYILLAVFAVRTGRLVCLVALVVLSLAASVYWHWLSISAIGT